MVALSGNHEDMLKGFLQDERMLDGWRAFGGLETIHSYGIDVGAASTLYMQAMMALPAWQEWYAAALEEEWLLEEDEVDWPTVLRVDRSAGVPPAP